MNRVRIDFLNWQPDLEDFNNPGLIEADNVYHQAEGFKEFKSKTASAQATSTAIPTSPSLIVKSVGTNNQKVVAYLHNATAAGAGYTIDFSIGLFSSGYTTVANYTTITSSTITSAATSNRVVAFQVCEYGDNIFVSAQAELPTITILNAGAAPVVTLNATGYMAT